MSVDRGISFGKNPVEAAAADFAHNRAYVIGINAYQNGIPQLRTAVADAERLGNLLEESHGYNVFALPKDGAPTLFTLRELIHNQMPQQVGPDDRVLLYFAGHGIALDGDGGPEGYLVPEDANREDRASFLPMTELSDALGELPCRHMLLILDCCFAGAFRWSSTRDLSALPSVIHRERYDRYIRDPAWQVLTSAAYDQKALDVLSGNTIGERIETAEHSPFAAALFRALAGDADLIPRGKDGQPGGDGVITATELYLYLREYVETATVEQRTRQTPGLWPLKKHDKGEYILLSPGHELNLPPAPELNYANNPYRGLQSFEEENSQLFFGRAKEIEELRTLVSSQPLTVVLGASGTGKSSLVKAGLLPLLRSVDDEDWQILPTIRPGKSPLATLASLTLPGEATGTDEASRLAELSSDDNAFAQRIQTWAAAHPCGSQLLLIVDQFEELVALCWDCQERDRFIGLLALALNAQPDRFRLVFTIRSDFEPQFSACALSSCWISSRYVVPAMSIDDLREAIEGPASVRVLYFQPAGLVDRLIDEVIQTPGAMPLLSFTLSELYVRYLQRRGDDRCLTLADFEQLGGVAGSLRSRATELYEKLDGPHQATMQRIMLRMVSAQGGELARRRVPKSELEYPSDNENKRVAAILNRLSEARLIVEGKEVDGEPYVEPAHDALVRGWDKLLAWTRSEQEQLTLRRLLTPAAIDWQRHKGGTWHTNPRLSLLRRVQESPENWLNNTESGFVNRSVAKRRRILVGTSGIVAVAFLILAVITHYAILQRDDAIAKQGKLDIANQDLEESIEIQKQKTAEAEQNAENDRVARVMNRAQIPGHEVDALVGALDVVASRANTGKSPRGDELRFLGDAVIAAQSSFPLRGHTSWVRVVQFAPDGRTLLTGSGDGTIRIWDTSTCRLLRVLQGSEGVVVALRFRPDGQRVLACGWNKAARIWDVTDGRSLTVLGGHDSVVQDGCFTRSGDLVLTASGTTISIWNSSDGVLVRSLVGKRDDGFSLGPVQSVLLSPDESRVLALHDGHISYIWNANTGERLTTLDIGQGNLKGAVFMTTDDGLKLITLSMEGRRNLNVWDVATGKSDRILDHQGYGYVLALSPDQSTLATGDTGGTIQLWRTDDWTRVNSLPGHSETIENLTFSPDGMFLVSASSDNTARIWRTADGKNVRELRGHSGSVMNVAFNGDGTRVATASKDNTARLWRMGREGQLQSFRSHQDRIATAAFTGVGHHFFSAGGDGRLFLWDERNKAAVAERDTLLVSITKAVASPHGDRIFTSGKKGNDYLCQMWNVGTKLEKAFDFQSPPGIVWCATFSPNGSVIATGHRNGTIEISDSGTGVRIGTLPGHKDGVHSIEFSRDGEHIVSTGRDNTAVIWNWKAEEEYARFPHPVYGGRAIATSPIETTLSPDGSRLILNIGSVVLFNVPDSEVIVTIKKQSQAQPAARFSPDGDLVVTACGDGSASVWDAATGQLIREIAAHRGWVSDVQISPDQRQLLTFGRDDNTVKIWNLETGELLTAHILPGSITGGEFSPDGQYVLVWVGTELRLYAAAVEPLVSHAVSLIRYQPEGVPFLKLKPQRSAGDAETEVTD
ncbi:nSTAND1 domain-containing NTPase [Allorhodopirellula solitaria]|uniref:Translocation protein TolB n=1 Tax=Allorhodopirellula solitaria TaxID=2527987 RepID=A0A5C5WNU0_9BACT|nr:caspase family protein [Allorhodopirellula solitaria]TWT51801.1 translocation protein TolB [Allorhodopirellula solitaria]